MGGWTTDDIRGGFGTGLWKDIRKNWSTLSQNAIFSLGDSRRLRFWKDIWCGEVALSTTFPTLFNLAAHKDAKVADVWYPSRVERGWSLVFVRSFNDWEVEEVERFLCSLHNRKIRLDQEDNLLMKDSKNAGYSVRLMYRLLDHSLPSVFPFRSIWNPIVPHKLGFLAWEASWGKVLTLDQVKKRGITLANRCFLCEEEKEKIDHMLIHCPIARMLWDLFLAISGFSWVFPLSVCQTLLAWQGTKVGKKRQKIWMVAPLCLFWTLWRKGIWRLLRM